MSCSTFFLSRNACCRKAKCDVSGVMRLSTLQKYCLVKVKDVGAWQNNVFQDKDDSSHLA